MKTTKNSLTKMPFADQVSSIAKSLQPVCQGDQVTVQTCWLQRLYGLFLASSPERVETGEESGPGRGAHLVGGVHYSKANIWTGACSAFVSWLVGRLDCMAEKVCMAYNAEEPLRKRRLLSACQGLMGECFEFIWFMLEVCWGMWYVGSMVGFCWLYVGCM